MKLEYLQKSTAQCGNESDTHGALFGECLILGMYPTYFDYEYVVLIPLKEEVQGYKYTLGFASKMNERLGSSTHEYYNPKVCEDTIVADIDFKVSKSLGLHNGGPAEFWGANPDQPQYEMYEGKSLTKFVNEIHKKLKDGWDPKLETFSIVKK